MDIDPLNITNDDDPVNTKTDEPENILNSENENPTLKMDESDSDTITTSQLNFEEFMTENNGLMSPSTSKLISSDKEVMRSKTPPTTNDAEDVAMIDISDQVSVPTTTVDEAVSDSLTTTTATIANNFTNEIISESDANKSKSSISSINTTKVQGTVKNSIIKIPPKATIAKNAAGQYVLIQPNGKIQPVRLATKVKTPDSTTTPTSSTTKPMTIQVIRTADGNLVPLKGNTKTINLNNINITGKKIIVKSNSGLTTSSTSVSPKILNTLAPSQTTTAPKILNAIAATSVVGALGKKPVTSPVTNISTSSVSGVQKILNTSTVPKILNSQMMKTVSLSSGSSNANKIILNKDIEVSAKKFTNSQTLVKITPTGTMTKVGSSNLSAGGGGNFKYVRILNPGVASSSSIDAPKSPQKFILKPSATLLNKMEIKLEKEDTIKVINAPVQDEGSSSKLTAPAKILNKIPVNREIKPPPKILNNLIPINGQQRIVASKGQFLLTPNQIKPINRLPHSGIIKIEDDHDEKLRQNVNSLLKPLNNSRQNSEKMEAQCLTITQQLKRLSPQPAMEPTDSNLRRKHCNCTKSQCLKLYCDCFANGEFCQDCNCKECFNNLEYEDERQKAIKITLERNPAAFKPKITKAKDQTDLRLHNKGCNCKRSGCLKNYCECYEAKIACSSNCKCMGCRNVEDRRDLTLVDVAERIASKNLTRTTQKRPIEEVEKTSQPGKFTGIGLNQRTQSPPPVNKPYNFITQDVVDATIQCMIAQADECQKTEISTKLTERMILEELGRCLVEIIDFSIRNIDN